MTNVRDVQGTQPGTHALVIGVGSYDHLLGGSGTPLDNPYGLGQLGSPPMSAALVADWLLHSLNNPAAPLASLEVLISAPAPASIITGAGPVEVEPATMANIGDAAARWFARANSNPDNVAFFYHCGHGVEGADLALLAQDFGAPGGAPASKWKGAYNFHRSYLGMARCVARGQVFFVDSCRQVLGDVIADDGQDLQVLVSPGLRDNRRRSAPILFATARESRAFAPSGAVSVFAGALIAALSSNGAERDPLGVWQVSTDLLGRAVRARINLVRDETTPPQECVMGGESEWPVMLNTLHNDPTVPILVTAAGLAESTCLEFWQNGEPTPGTTLVGPSPWRHELPAARYQIVARNGAATVADLAEEWVRPPVYERVLT